MTRRHRRRFERNKERAIKTGIIIIPLIITAMSLGYAKGMEVEYKTLKNTIINHEGSLAELKDKIR